MKEGLAIGDALHVIQHGCVFREPEFDVKFRQWRYCIQGTEPDGKYVGVIFAVEGVGEGVLMTIFSIDAH
jgi:hypothetical protein